MPYRKTIFLPGHYYHIFNRGIRKQAIFLQDSDYLHFLELVHRYMIIHPVTIIVYCLMPNHFHFILHPDEENSISYFISQLLNSYVKTINLKYNREGRLFIDRFKSRWIDKDEYFIHLMRYIHRNPLEADLVKKIEDWPFSNYPEFIGLRRGKLYDSKMFSTYFDSSKDYQKFVDDINVQALKGLDNYTLE